MPIVLTTPFSPPNGTRLVFGRFDFNDDREEMNVPVSLVSPPATGRIYATFTMVVRNGLCTHVSRQTAPPQGLRADETAAYFVVTTRDIPTGYTEAKTAERGAPNSPGARRAALEAFMLNAGHIDASLSGA